MRWSASTARNWANGICSTSVRSSSLPRMDDISVWLEGLGLGQYAQLFAENAIDPDIVLELTEPDLAGLGIVLGHRKKILKAIEQLKEEQHQTATATHPEA